MARQLRPVTEVGPRDAVGACAVVCCVAPQRRVAIGRAHVAVTAAPNALAVAVVYDPRVTCGGGSRLFAVGPCERRVERGFGGVRARCVFYVAPRWIIRSGNSASAKSIAAVVPAVIARAGVSLRV